MDASDRRSVGLLLVLYTLQGVPMGLASSLGLVMQERGGLSFSEQAIFSLATWPFSLKLLWAPLVDAFYWRAVGRRKSWLVPVQLGLALLLLLSPPFVQTALHSLSSASATARAEEEVVGSGMLNYLDTRLAEMGRANEDRTKEEVLYLLTTLFFVLYFLAATQDIAVDGWAVEMLSEKNVGWASTCNVLGATFGYFFAFTGFLTMRAYAIPILGDLGSFMRMWGFIFLVVTLLVAILKQEIPRKRRRSDDDIKQDEEKAQQGNESQICATYSQMVNLVLTLRPVQTSIFLLLTRTLAFCASDQLTVRKMMKVKGLTSEHVSSIMLIVTPVSMILPGIISRETSTRPMRFYMKVYIPRMMLCLVSMVVFYFMPQLDPKEPLPFSVFAAFLFLTLIQSLVQTIQFTAIMAFHAKISDPAIGGTYMTLFNTMANLGSSIPNQIILLLVEPLTSSKTCSLDNEVVCSTPEMERLCEEQGGSCASLIDGYYVLVIASFIWGLCWYSFFLPLTQHLESLPESSWRLQKES